MRARRLYNRGAPGEERFPLDGSRVRPGPRAAPRAGWPTKRWARPDFGPVRPQVQASSMEGARDPAAGAAPGFTADGRTRSIAKQFSACSGGPVSLRAVYSEHFRPTIAQGRIIPAV